MGARFQDFSFASQSIACRARMYLRDFYFPRSIILGTSLCLIATPAVRATDDLAQSLAIPERNLLLRQAVPERDLPPPQDVLPLPAVPPQPAPVSPPILPPPSELLKPSEVAPRLPADDAEAISPEATLCITGFRVLGSTVFSAEQLEQAINQALREVVGAANQSQPDCPWQLTFAQLLRARSAVTELYVEQGYVTSGAFLPANQRLQKGVVTLQVIEGRLVDIDVDGTKRLKPGYISRRLNVAAAPPFNVNDLLAGLRLLQLDPLIETITAELQPGTAIGTSRLAVKVAEADSFRMQAGLDNYRSPSIGSFQRLIGLQQGNLLGFGDRLNIFYFNTDGSNEVDLSYTVPVNPYNGTVQFATRFLENRVVDGAFQPLDISAKANEYVLTFQQPVVQTPDSQLNLGVSLGRRFSQTRLGFDDIGPFPLSPGADSLGRTVISALAFSQSWTKRQPQQVLALQSQFVLGLGGFLGGTVNSDPEVPDNRFFVWEGQGQLVRRLGRDGLLLFRGGAQLAANALLPVEQIGIGGQQTVRGYRQNDLLTDSGLLASIEARLPIMRLPKVGGLLQVTPFLDTGYGWNVRGATPSNNTLVGIGTGLLWQQQNLSVRFDWGIPLTKSNAAINQGTATLQENGLYFSVNYSFF